MIHTWARCYPRNAGQEPLDFEIMNATHWRVQELKHHSADIVWLDAEEARRAYDLVGLHDSKTHLGLTLTHR